MGKPKKYIGETWSNPFDHGGKDYRWDHKKKEYVVSHGESPIASITRALKEKFPDPLKHLDDARDERDKKWAEGLEGISESLTGSDEAEDPLTSIGTIIEGLASIKRTHDNRKKSGEPTETNSGDNVARQDFNFYMALDVDYFKDATDDAGMVNWKNSQNLDPDNAMHNLLKKNIFVNKETASLNEPNSHYQMMLKKEAAKAEARNQWLQETSNSPAAKAFEPDDPRRESWDKMRYEQHLKHTGQDTVDTNEAKIEEDKIKQENTVIEDNKKKDNINVEKDTKTIFKSATNDDKKRSLLGNANP